MYSVFTSESEQRSCFSTVMGKTETNILLSFAYIQTDFLDIILWTST